MNECFTDPIFKISELKGKKAVKAGVRQRKEKELRERLVIQ